MNAVLGGEPLGDDLAYGPARSLTVREVQEVATALNDISVEDFAARCDFAAMIEADIYPSIWSDSPEELVEYLTSYYSGLVDFFKKAARENNAMLLYVD